MSRESDWAKRKKAEKMVKVCAWVPQEMRKEFLKYGLRLRNRKERMNEKSVEIDGEA